MAQAASSVVHLGDESPNTYRLAEKYLGEGKTVSLVGKGESMDPIIPHDTRMIFKPYKDSAAARGRIKPGTPLLTRKRVRSNQHGTVHIFMNYSCHMAWMVAREHVLIGWSDGTLDYWVDFDGVLGVYDGPFTGEAKPIVYA